MNETKERKFCWETYPSSGCDTCQYYQAFKAGTLDIKKVKEIVLVDD